MRGLGSGGKTGSRILHTAFLLNFEYKSSDRRCFIIYSITLRISGLQKKFVFLLFIFASMSIIIEFLSNLRSCPLSQLLGGKTEPIYYRYSLFYTPFSNRRNNFLGKCALLKKYKPISFLISWKRKEISQKNLTDLESMKSDRFVVKFEGTGLMFLPPAILYMPTYGEDEGLRGGGGRT